MKIGVDVRMIESSGIGTSVRLLLDHRPPNLDEKIFLFGRPGWVNPYPLSCQTVSWPIYSLSQHWSYARFLKKQNLSVCYMPHYDIPWFFTGNLVATVHDLNHMLFPKQATKPFASFYARLVMGRLVKRARRILVDSENTQNDLLRFFPQASRHSEIVHLGIDPVYKPVSESKQSSILKKYGLSPGYILYVGNLRGTKNTEGLIRAYGKFRSRQPTAPELVLVGKNFLTGRYAEGKFPDGIRYAGHVEGTHLPALYSAASVFVFPTFYEGFGLPPLEAMACGTPVVASRVSSLPEVCGDAAEYVDPASEESIARGLEAVLSSSSRRSELKEKGFRNIQRFSASAYANRAWKIILGEAGPN